MGQLLQQRNAAKEREPQRQVFSHLERLIVMEKIMKMVQRVRKDQLLSSEYL